MYKLDPVLDECGIFRAAGRIKFSSLPNDSKHRVILHRESSVTELIICHYHQAILKHQGRGMSQCRLLDYWRELHRFQPHLEMCDVSKEDLRMTDLPADRLEPAPSFTFAEIYFFGP